MSASRAPADQPPAPPAPTEQAEEQPKRPTGRWTTDVEQTFFDTDDWQKQESAVRPRRWDPPTAVRVWLPRPARNPGVLIAAGCSLLLLLGLWALSGKSDRQPAPAAAAPVIVVPPPAAAAPAPAPAPPEAAPAPADPPPAPARLHRSSSSHGKHASKHAQVKRGQHRRR
jgi:hypothetical protein